MTPARFTECLLCIRWTPINLASALQCDLSWVEAMEVGNAEVPAGLAAWLETLARCHEAAGIPTTYRERGHSEERTDGRDHGLSGKSLRHRRR
ncbi:hypothetical protein Rleg10DRAFT_3633 [Rhizobium leguminosarum bv. trifolii WSM2012]|nr:hypothetical protein Rleg10DRAFT_3633 [Rhizobium leguminosarum bv. trifolii WSM2012]